MEWIYEAASEFHKNDFLFFVWKMGDGDEIEGERDEGEGEGEGEGGGTQANGGITACRAGAVSALFHVGWLNDKSKYERDESTCDREERGEREWGEWKVSLEKELKKKKWRENTQRLLDSWKVTRWARGIRKKTLQKFDVSITSTCVID
jgi:hypothetical protein